MPVHTRQKGTKKTMQNHPSTPLDLERHIHPDRSSLAHLLTDPTAMAPDTLINLVQAETRSWAALLAGAPNSTAIRQMLSGVRHALDALQYEERAYQSLAEAQAAQHASAWAPAAIAYTHALSHLTWANSCWSSALTDVAAETPFDPYYPDVAQQQREQLPPPQRSSLVEMQEISRHLLRVYQSLDRVHSVSLELAQRQITCLTAYLHEAEAGGSHAD
jgi:hypothetical protein